MVFELRNTLVRLYTNLAAHGAAVTGYKKMCRRDNQANQRSTLLYWNVVASPLLIPEEVHVNGAGAIQATAKRRGSMKRLVDVHLEASVAAENEPIRPAV